MKKMIKGVLCILCFLLSYQSRSKDWNSFVRVSSTRNLAYKLSCSKFIPEQTAPQKEQPEPKAASPKLIKRLLDFIGRKNKKALNDSLLAAIKNLGLENSKTRDISTEQYKILISKIQSSKDEDLNATIKGVLKKLEEQKEKQKPTSLASDENNSKLSTAPMSPEAIPNPALALLDQEIKKKNDKIRQINEIKRADPKNLTVQLKNKAAIYGFYNITKLNERNGFLFQNFHCIYYSLIVDESTGEFINLDEWLSSSFSKQKSSGSNQIYYSLLIPHKSKVSRLVSDSTIQNNLILNLKKLLRTGTANGLHISIKNLKLNERIDFSRFIKRLSMALKEEKSDCELFLTIPREDTENAYNLERLNSLVDKFFIDYNTQTSRIMGPLAPLGGAELFNIDAAITKYSTNIDRGKMVIVLPYKGTRWITDSLKTTGRFENYISYASIKKKSIKSSKYQDEYQSFYLDEGNEGKFYRIWYDNELTLANKFDYIIDNKLGGVGVFPVDDDGSSNELNNVVAHKFIKIDSTKTVIKKSDVPKKNSYFNRIIEYFPLWIYILENPCEINFNNIETVKKDKLTLLKDEAFVRYNNKGTSVISSIINFLTPDNDKKYPDENERFFKLVLHELDFLLLVFMVFFCLLLCVTIAIYINGIRKNSDKWIRKELTGLILIGVASLFAFFLFTFMFTNESISLFGSSVPGKNCVNIPYSTLDIIIGGGFVIGWLYRYLYTAIYHKENLP